MVRWGDRAVKHGRSWAKDGKTRKKEEIHRQANRAVMHAKISSSLVKKRADNKHLHTQSPHFLVCILDTPPWQQPAAHTDIVHASWESAQSAVSPWSEHHLNEINKSHLGQGSTAALVFIKREKDSLFLIYLFMLPHMHTNTDVVQTMHAHTLICTLAL